MIKFFRNIRFNLMVEGQASRYLKYAIGEILLVVIGILIALQINNWNENRKESKREQVILQAILTSINEDLDLYENAFERRLERKRSGIDSLISYITNPRPLSDSLINVWYEDMKTDIVIRYDSGPFEALKSAGLDLIKTDSLRSIINDTYSMSLPALQRFANMVSERRNNSTSGKEENVMTLIPITHDDGEQHLHLYPKLKNIIENEDFQWIIYAEQNKLSSFENRTKSIKRFLNKMKTAIEAELDQ